ncbi:hypothetical protein [Rhodococcus sp. T7]|uniref:hypothetical protein n=1 Tax=Rhodococcus sp. T7 TaxID=627444 RepID=UPI001359A4C1|nr:hypothetical protein [Rhodococcus sp. T7]KAF0964655.1 hypothetical protein MLGJGCBP_02198 [Rhodococcus sp. T7]
MEKIKAGRARVTNQQKCTTGEWFTAVERNPSLTRSEVLTGHELIGCPTDLTAEEVDGSLTRLEAAGFIRQIGTNDNGPIYTLELPQG